MWKVRTSGRLDEMSSGKLSLRVEIQGDGDIVIFIENDGVPIEDAEGNRAQVEFCNTGSGGGRSSHTRKALVELFHAMKKDAKERPDGIPPFPLWLREEMAKDP